MEDRCYERRRAEACVGPVRNPVLSLGWRAHGRNARGRADHEDMLVEAESGLFL